MPDPYYQDDSVTIYHGDCYEFVEWRVCEVAASRFAQGVLQSA